MTFKMLTCILPQRSRTSVNMPVNVLYKNFKSQLIKQWGLSKYYNDWCTLKSGVWYTLKLKGAQLSCCLVIWHTQKNNNNMSSFDMAICLKLLIYLQDIYKLPTEKGKLMYRNIGIDATKHWQEEYICSQKNLCLCVKLCVTQPDRSGVPST